MLANSSLTARDERPELLVIVGPTAAGKSAAALVLAERLGAELISADSLAVYRGFDIGAAKPTRADRERVVHHLLDVVEPTEPFTAADFARLADTAIDAIARPGGRGRRAIVVGGTGLYVRALLDGLWDAPPADEQLRAALLAEEAAGGEGTLLRELTRVDQATAARLQPRDLVRIVRALEVFRQTGRPLSAWHAEHRERSAGRRYRATLLGLAPERERLRANIERRVASMVAAGLVDEVRGLLSAGVGADAKPMGGLGYRHVITHLRQGVPLDATLDSLRRDTVAFARRQLTWFRADPTVRWFASTDELLAAALTAASQHTR